VITTWTADLNVDAGIWPSGVGSSYTGDCVSTLSIGVTVVTMQADPMTGEIYAGITRAMQVL